MKKHAEFTAKAPPPPPELPPVLPEAGLPEPGDAEQLLVVPKAKGKAKAKAREVAKATAKAKAEAKAGAKAEPKERLEPPVEVTDDVDSSTWTWFEFCEMRNDHYWDELQVPDGVTLNDHGLPPVDVRIQREWITPNNLEIASCNDPNCTRHWGQTLLDHEDRRCSIHCHLSINGNTCWYDTNGVGYELRC